MSEATKSQTTNEVNKETLWFAKRSASDMLIRIREQTVPPNEIMATILFVLSDMCSAFCGDEWENLDARMHEEVYGKQTVDE